MQPLIIEAFRRPAGRGNAGFNKDGVRPGQLEISATFLTETGKVNTLRMPLHNNGQLISPRKMALNHMQWRTLAATAPLKENKVSRSRNLIDSNRFNFTKNGMVDLDTDKETNTVIADERLTLQNQNNTSSKRLQQQEEQTTKANNTENIKDNKPTLLPTRRKPTMNRLFTQSLRQISRNDAADGSRLLAVTMGKMDMLSTSSPAAVGSSSSSVSSSPTVGKVANKVANKVVNKKAYKKKDINRRGHSLSDGPYCTSDDAAFSNSSETEDETDESDAQERKERQKRKERKERKKRKERQERRQTLSTRDWDVGKYYDEELNSWNT